MATKVHVLSAYPESPGNFAACEVRKYLHEHDAGSQFVHVPQPGLADVILFVEHHPACDPLYWKVYSHPVFRKYGYKCVLYHDSDYAIPVIPGIYPSWDGGASKPAWVKTSPYFFQHVENPLVGVNRDYSSVKFLYSFTGAVRTHPCRREIMNLCSDDRGSITDTSNLNAWQLSPDEQKVYHRKFADALSESLFILCPRGISPCSYRLTETLNAGRVPVVISDQWSLPDWLPWTEFALVIAEADIQKLPEILRQKEKEAIAMGKRASDIWDLYFSSQNRYTTLLELASGVCSEGKPQTSTAVAMINTLWLAARHKFGATLLRQQAKSMMHRWYSFS